MGGQWADEVPIVGLAVGKWQTAKLGVTRETMCLTIKLTMGLGTDTSFRTIAFVPRDLRRSSLIRSLPSTICFGALPQTLSAELGRGSLGGTRGIVGMGGCIAISGQSPRHISILVESITWEFDDWCRGWAVGRRSFVSSKNLPLVKKRRIFP